MKAIPQQLYLGRASAFAVAYIRLAVPFAAMWLARHESC